MLTRDLECLHTLYRDAESIVEAQSGKKRYTWYGGASENAFSLGRTTILTCFNLLESFTSGLALSYVMSNPQLSIDEQKKILDTNGSLKNRFLSVPRKIMGREPSLDVNKPPLSELFGSVKQYRDSFVHCVPGEEPSRFGYVKQHLFNDVSLTLVDRAVALTHEAIEGIWKDVHGVDGPRWLHSAKNDKVCKRVNLTVAPPSATDEVARQ